jgi:hypothetical protein
VQAKGVSRTRMITGAAAVAGAAAIATVPALAAPRLALLGAPGVVLIAGAAWRWGGLLGPGIALLAAETIFVLPSAAWPPWAALTAVSLFLVAELAAWAREALPAVTEEAPVARARARMLALVTPALGAVVTLVLAFAAAAPPGDLSRLAVGVSAGTALLCLLTFLARRAR